MKQKVFANTAPWHQSQGNTDAKEHYEQLLHLKFAGRKRRRDASLEDWRRASCASESPLSRLRCSFSCAGCADQVLTCCGGLVQFFFLSSFGNFSRLFVAIFTAQLTSSERSAVFHDSRDLYLTRCVGLFPRTFHRLPVLEGEAGPLARAPLWRAHIPFLRLDSCSTPTSQYCATASTRSRTSSLSLRPRLHTV